MYSFPLSLINKSSPIANVISGLPFSCTFPSDAIFPELDVFPSDAVFPELDVFPSEDVSPDVALFPDVAPLYSIAFVTFGIPHTSIDVANTAANILLLLIISFLSFL